MKILLFLLISLISITAQSQSTNPLNYAVNKWARYMVKNHSDAINSTLRAQSFEHNGFQIYFNYQFWKINKESVCNNYKGKKYNQYSDCTVAAKDMFIEICRKATLQPIKINLPATASGMYCRAADNYKPIIAKASISKELTDLEKARRECNSAIMIEQGNRNFETTKERKIACDKYENLK